MRLSFFKKPSKSKTAESRDDIERNALKTLRQVRKSMLEEHGDAMEAISELYERTQLAAADQQKENQQKADSTEIPIDRKKNLETVAKFLAKTDSEVIKRSIKDMV